MRHAFILLHRWMGLATALFLFVAGLTGAVISWEHELDEWLNPHLFKLEKTTGRALPPVLLARAVEAADLRVRVSGVPLQYEPGHAAVLWVDAKLDPGTGRRFQTGYNQVFVDPGSAEIIGRREWGKAALDREHLMSFLYKLHFSLQVPEMGGTDRWGVWFMGVVALIWLGNSVLSFFLTLPVRRGQKTADGAAIPESAYRGWWQEWKPAWQIKRRASWFRVNFDLHRAGGLWFMGLILILAFTSFSLNLYREAFYPVMSLLSEVTPGPFDQRRPTPLHQPVEPSLGWQDLVERGSLEAQRRKWEEPAGDAFYADNYGIHAVRFYHGDAEMGSAGLGAKTLYYDGRSGKLLGAKVPWEGTVADKFVQLQFPLHSGRLLGDPGRILVSCVGLATAMLSLTGVIIWWKKRSSIQAVQKNKQRKLAIS